MRYLQNYSFLLILIFFVSCGYEKLENLQTVKHLPNIYPDYIGVTVPRNICPLDFDMASYDYQKIDVEISCKNDKLHYQNDGAIAIDEDSWHNLLINHQMDSISFFVSVKIDNKWLQFLPFYIYVDSTDIDYSVVYRRIAPAYSVFSDIGLYQRELSSFKETNLINSTQLQNQCMNCHTFNRTKADNYLFHIRGQHSGTYYKSGDTTTIFVTKTDSTLNNFAYSYYHPGGRYIVSSMNTTRQLFRTGNYQRLDVFDGEADIAVFDQYKREILPAPHIRSKAYFEDFPAFSHDGKKIYFARCDSMSMPLHFQDVHFNICSVDFDEKNRVVGQKIDTLIDAKSMNLSATQARPSYDGKYIMYTMMEYGDFAIWHKKADLWIYDLQTNQNYKLNDANSKESEAYHNWSKDSKWFVFASRRKDGVYSQLFFAKILPKGHCTKPFLLPQRDPKNFQDNNTHSFNAPDFCIEPINLDKTDILNKVYGQNRERVKFIQ